MYKVTNYLADHQQIKALLIVDDKPAEQLLILGWSDIDFIDHCWFDKSNLITIVSNGCLCRRSRRCI